MTERDDDAEDDGDGDAAGVDDSNITTTMVFTAEYQRLPSLVCYKDRHVDQS